MNVNFFKGPSVESISGVIGCNVLNSDTPTIQLIHEDSNTKTIHCDLFQSEDYTALTIDFSFPTPEE